MFLKWRRDNYPLLKSEHPESNFLWQAWKGRAAVDAKENEPKCPKYRKDSFNLNRTVM